MTRKEINERIEQIERRQFYLMMKDFWNAKDFELDRQYTRELKELKAKLNEE